MSRKMVFRYFKIITATILLSIASRNVTCISYSSSTNSGFLNESKLIMRSLEEGLKYFVTRPETVNDDVVLGILIANANLRWVYDKFKYYSRSDSWENKQLERLLSLCYDVIDINKSRNSGILNKSLWENSAEDLKSGLLNSNDVQFFLPDFHSCQDIDSYMMTGTPKDSDFCIKELLSSRCEVSDYCWFSEVNATPHSGYKTSHRLLYFQIAFLMNCEETNSRKFFKIRRIKRKLCQQMFLEAVALYQRPSISVTLDLFMEQIALCGLEGFEEFAPGIWRDQLRSWQKFNGCFGLGTNFTNCSDVTKRDKRTDSKFGDCHTHITAVAISALAFFVRVTLKLAYNLP